MKARCKPAYSMTRQQLKKVDEYVGMAVAARENLAMARWYKLTLYMLNRNFGFGKKRLSDAMTQIDNLISECKRDEEAWSHIDKEIQKMGIESIPSDDELVKLERRKLGL